MPNHPYSAADFAEVILVGIKIGRTEIFKQLEDYFHSKDEDFRLDTRVSDIVQFLNKLKKQT